jgi:hypothetical protein
MLYLFQVINKGLVSYRDPESAPGRGQKTLNVTRDMDLTKLFVKCLRELSDAEGSTLARVENRIRNLYVVQVSGAFMRSNVFVNKFFNYFFQ